MNLKLTTFPEIHDLTSQKIQMDSWDLCETDSKQVN